MGSYLDVENLEEVMSAIRRSLRRLSDPGRSRIPMSLLHHASHDVDFVLTERQTLKHEKERRDTTAPYGAYL